VRLASLAPAGDISLRRLPRPVARDLNLAQLSRLFMAPEGSPTPAQLIDHLYLGNKILQPAASRGIKTHRTLDATDSWCSCIAALCRYGTCSFFYCHQIAAWLQYFTAESVAPSLAKTRLEGHRVFRKRRSAYCDYSRISAAYQQSTQFWAFTKVYLDRSLHNRVPTKCLSVFLPISIHSDHILTTTSFALQCPTTTREGRSWRR
jgi:hypothetical protein